MAKTILRYSVKAIGFIQYTYQNIKWGHEGVERGQREENCCYCIRYKGVDLLLILLVAVGYSRKRQARKKWNGKLYYMQNNGVQMSFYTRVQGGCYNQICQLSFSNN